MEWELSKENIRPLKQGRNVDNLNAVLKARLTPSAHVKIAQEHRKMLEAIDDYVGDDPLEPWLCCIQWVKEAYPSEGNQSGLLKLLELCVRTFCKDQQYKKDLRYLKVWLDYADRCKDPCDIFSFLQDNKIGQDYAMFYEACGRFWEHQEKFVDANDIFLLGIARKAQPPERLNSIYNNFLKRSAKRRDDKKDDSSIKHPGLERVFGTSIAVGPSAHTQSSVNQRMPSSQRNKATGFSVFVDPICRHNSSSVHNHDKSGVSNYNSINADNKFIPESETMKENIQLPVKWMGEKIPQKTVGTVTSLPCSNVNTVKLDVYVDEDVARRNAAIEKEKSSKSSMSIRLRLDDIIEVKREADRLQQNPLVHFIEDGLHF